MSKQNDRFPLEFLRNLVNPDEMPADFDLLNTVNHGCRKQQRHVHEFLGSVKIAEENEDPHNHRFAGVTGEAIPCGENNHIHKLETNTDFYEDHFHRLADRTGPAIWVNPDKHVHFVKGETTVSDGHTHEYNFATLIENPIGD